MKSLKEFLAEDVTQVHGHKSVMGQILSRTEVLIPVSDSTLKAISLNPPEVVGYHVMSHDKVPFLEKIEGTKKSISIFADFPSQYNYDSGVEGGGGVLAVVKGKPVLSSHYDAYTVVDSNGRRWVPLDVAIRHLGRPAMKQLLKQQSNRAWIKNVSTGEMGKIRDTLKRMASKILHRACDKARVFDMIFSLNDDWWSANGMRPPFDKFYQAKETSERNAVCVTLQNFFRSGFATPKQKQVFIKTYMDEMNKLLKRYKRQMRIILFPVMYTDTMEQDMRGDINETVIHSIEILAMLGVVYKGQDTDNPNMRSLVVREKEKFDRLKGKYNTVVFEFAPKDGEQYFSAKKPAFEKMKRYGEQVARIAKTEGL